MANKSKYRPEHCETLRKQMADGFSFEAACGTLGICKQTGYDWLKRFPDFQAACDEGRTLGQLFWERAAINGLWGDKDNKFNSSVWIFTMKNQYGWKDKKEISGGIGLGEAYKDLSPAQIEQKISEILSRLPKPGQGDK